MLLPRVLTVLLILPLFLAALFLAPQAWWGGIILLVVVAACFEWSRLAALNRTQGLLFTFVVAGSCVAVWLAGSGPAATAVLGLALLFWLIAAPGLMRRPERLPRLVLAAAGVLVLCSSWFALYDLHRSPSRLLALMCVVWIADTGAYFAGRAFGRRKLAPSISPGKTWEGVAGGAAGVAVYYLALWWLWSPPELAGNRLLDLAIVAGMTVLSIEGDLFESWLKRRAGVKDSGSVLPGHGGVLDRIDGVMAALPFAALLTQLSRG